MKTTISVLKMPCSLIMINDIAKAYQQTFAGYPWFEGYKCPMCQEGFSLVHTGKICTKCSTPEKQVLLADYWPTDTIISDFNKEMAKPGAICVVAKVDKEIIGFTWGYNVLCSPELDDHLDAPNLHKRHDGEYFYLDEVAVAPDYQKNGIGRKLVARIIGEQSQKQILLRTKEDGSMFNLVVKIGGEVIQRISRYRVIMKIIIKK